MGRGWDLFSLRAAVTVGPRLEFQDQSFANYNKHNPNLIQNGVAAETYLGVG